MQENNKRIAKNTFYLYIRMLLSMVISLYTSRVVLATLGFSDYGLYGVVGGIVGMFSILNNSMAGTTSRFIAFELGTSNNLKLQKTFSATFTVHILIAILVFLLAETLGVWWLENKIVMPEGRITAARIVYQLSVLSAVITITQVPYNAAIIAHERMKVYAYVELLNSGLRLLIVYLLVIGNFDKLILYAILMFFVSLIVMCIYRVYCLRKFEECRYNFEWDRQIMQPILSFSGWDLYGSVCSGVRGSGINLLLNMFFGTIVNAANGVAGTVNAYVNILAGNFMAAVRPQITKYYAKGEIVQMQNLINNASKFVFLLSLILVLPVMLECNFILNIWLKEVPVYSASFLRIIMFGSLFFFFMVPGYAIHATGKIKQISLGGGSIYLLVLPIVYILLKMGVNPIVPFIINVIFGLIANLFWLFVLHYLIPQFSVLKYFFNVICICGVVAILSSILPTYFHYSMQESWYRFVFVCFASIISIALFGYYVGMSKEVQAQVLELIEHKLKKLKIRFNGQKLNNNQ